MKCRLNVTYLVGRVKQRKFGESSGCYELTFINHFCLVDEYIYIYTYIFFSRGKDL
jgi:hypothetical protein